MGPTLSNPVGIFAVWAQFTNQDARTTAAQAAELEELGYGALWLGMAQPGLALAEPILGATSRLVLATGVLNVWTSSASEVAAAFSVSPYRDRLLLGIGAGHRETNGTDAITPMAAVRRFLDDLPSIDRDHLALAALGPRMLALAAERTAGTHTFMSPPEHTAHARDILGDHPVIAPVQAAILDTDHTRARDLARAFVGRASGTTNYRANLIRLGYTEEDFTDGGSDRLIDALVVHGDETAIAQRVQKHLDAGATHVAVHLLTPGFLTPPRFDTEFATWMNQYRRLAPALTNRATR